MTNVFRWSPFIALRTAALLLGAPFFIATGVASARVIPPVVVPSAGGVPWTDAERAALRAKLDRLFANAAAIRGAHVGLYAVDTRDRSMLYARIPDDEFMPASTLKLLVGSVSLAKLGTAFRFHTDAFFTRPVQGGVEPGQLVLRGGGDPFLNAGDLAGLSKAVAAQAQSVRLGVAIDASLFDREPYPPGWVWDDLPFYYAPVISATSFEENVVHLNVAAGVTVGAVARVSAAPLDFVSFADPGDPCAPTVEVVVMPIAKTGSSGSDSTIDVARKGGCIAVVGSVPLGGTDTADGAVPSPPVFAYQALMAALQHAGVLASETASVSATSPDEHLYRLTPGDQRAQVWSHDSEALPRLVRDMWFPSDNLLAELLLKSLGVAGSGVPGTSEHGAAVERAWLHSIGVDPQTVTLRDGSGLSIYDRITPRDLVAILQADWNGPNRQVVLDALPVAGVRGTSREEFVDSAAAGRAFVKTGSMTHVRGLAGFIAPRKHGAVAFALMVDDWNGKSDQLDAFRADVLSALAGA